MLANGIVLRLETPLDTVVTDSDFGWPEHLARVQRTEVAKPPSGITENLGREFVMLAEMGLFIGRGVEVTLVSLEVNRAQIAVEAPKWMAVSRDDFTEQQHMEHQTRREQGRK